MRIIFFRKIIYSRLDQVKTKVQNVDFQNQYCAHSMKSNYWIFGPNFSYSIFKNLEFGSFRPTANCEWVLQRSQKWFEFFIYQNRKLFSKFSYRFLNPNICSNLNSNCSNSLYLRNLQEQVKKALFWTFSVWINQGLL